MSLRPSRKALVWGAVSILLMLGALFFAINPWRPREHIVTGPQIVVRIKDCFTDTSQFQPGLTMNGHAWSGDKLVAHATHVFSCGPYQADSNSKCNFD